MRVGVALLFQNYKDMDRYEAAERGEATGEMSVSDAQVMADQLELGELIEPLGFDAMWTFEHRSSPYIMLPNPQQYIAYFAGKTSRIDFGTMVTVVPWHDPVRLAENLALLTHMVGPNRRVRLGVGRGLGRREFTSLGIDMAMSRPRFDEGLAIIREAFRKEDFAFKGEAFDYRSIRVRPRPLSTEIVDDMYAVWTSDASREVAARAGLSPLTVPSKDLEDFKADLADFDEMRAKHGHPPAQPPILQLFMYCHKDPGYALEIADRYFGEYSDLSSRHYEFGGDHFNSIPSYESYQRDGKSFLGGVTSQREAALGSKKRIMREGLIGTPQQCIEQAHRVEEMLHPSEIVVIPTPGSIPKELAAESMKLFAAEALPEIHKIGRVLSNA